MEFFDLQTTLTVAVILTATAAVVLIDYLRKHRRLQQATSPEIAAPAWPGPPPLSNKEPLSYKNIASAPQAAVDPAPVLKQAAPEAPLEALIAVATPSRPPVEQRIERDTVTVKITFPSPSPDSAETNLPAVSLPPFTIDADLWERLISSQPKRNMLSAATDSPAAAKSQVAPSVVSPAVHMIREEPVQAGSQPGGMIQQAVLEKWIESEQRFTGLVLSVGINDTDSSMWHCRGLVQSIGNYIAGLLKAKDYCCRTSFDEFLMVCPGEQGAQAQRRLNHISEHLWDFQLRGMGACSILFSWGGVQVQDQPLAQAIASATERMRETKRSSPLAAPASAHRHAV